MSPAAQELFMSQIAPILMAAVPRVVIPVGAEDADELVQDALVAACEAVHRLEKRGKQIIPKSVAYYTIQRLKSGRRSTGAGRTDVMSPGRQLDGKVSLSSLDEPLLVNDENENLTLGDVLAVGFAKNAAANPARRRFRRSSPKFTEPNSTCSQDCPAASL